MKTRSRWSIILTTLFLSVPLTLLAQVQEMYSCGESITVAHSNAAIREVSFDYNKGVNAILSFLDGNHTHKSVAFGMNGKIYGPQEVIRSGGYIRSADIGLIPSASQSTSKIQTDIFRSEDYGLQRRFYIVEYSPVGTWIHKEHVWDIPSTVPNFNAGGPGFFVKEPGSEIVKVFGQSVYTKKGDANGHSGEVGALRLCIKPYRDSLGNFHCTKDRTPPVPLSVLPKEPLHHNSTQAGYYDPVKKQNAFVFLVRDGKDFKLVRTFLDPTKDILLSDTNYKVITVGQGADQMPMIYSPKFEVSSSGKLSIVLGWEVKEYDLLLKDPEAKVKSAFGASDFYKFGVLPPSNGLLLTGVSSLSAINGHQAFSFTYNTAIRGQYFQGVYFEDQSNVFGVIFHGKSFHRAGTLLHGDPAIISLANDVAAVAYVLEDPANQFGRYQLNTSICTKGTIGK